MTTPRAGDIVRGADGTVSKVLVVDEAGGAVHVRFYAGEYPDADAVRSAIAAGPLDWTIGHAPMSLAAFEKDGELVTNVPVTDDELEGYRYYLEATGSDKLPPGKPDSPKESLLAKLARLLGGST